VRGAQQEEAGHRGRPQISNGEQLRNESVCLAWEVVVMPRHVENHTSFCAKLLRQIGIQPEGRQLFHTSATSLSCNSSMEPISLHIISMIESVPPFSNPGLLSMGVTRNYLSYLSQQKLEHLPEIPNHLQEVLIRYMIQTCKQCKTYSSRDSHVVTHRSTNLPFNCLCMAERTGCPVFS
jgi:hypothetical protein